MLYDIMFKVFRKEKDIYCTIDGKEEQFALFTLFLGVATKEKIFKLWIFRIHKPIIEK